MVVIEALNGGAEIPHHILLPSYLPDNVAMYNAGVAAFDGGTRLLLPRIVLRPTVKADVPDRGTLWVYIQNGQQTMTGAQPLAIHAPPDVYNVEDVRCAPPGSDGVMTLGCTAVIEKNHQFVPHPAFVHATFDGTRVRTDSLKVVRHLKGKNVTPINNRQFLVRLQGETHRIHLYQHLATGPQVEKILDFRTHIKPWMTGIIGTVVAPMPTGYEDIQLMLIHGYPTFKNKYEYQLGVALITDRWKVLAVGSQPICNRKSFADYIPEYEELHPYRAATYCTGVTHDRQKNEVTLYMSAGDLVTDLQTYSMDFLIAACLK